MSFKVETFKEILKSKNLTIACAESITAGLLSSTIASVSGASSVLRGSIVTYNQELKTELLDVKKETLDKYTAESMETTKEMVEGLSKLGLGASIYVAVTGAASSPSKDYKQTAKQGQVFIVIKYLNSYDEIDHIFHDEDRNVIREKTVDLILDRVLKFVGKS